MIHPRRTLNAGGRLISLDRPLIMGILNVTPDSFFDGGRYVEMGSIRDRAGRMLEEGADMIDIGGMSTRPGAKPVSEKEELDRVLPAIRAILDAWPDAFLSIDTVRSAVAREAVGAGVRLVNDISAGTFDASMYETVAQLKVPYILMHMQGSPEKMQDKPAYRDVVLDILDFFIREVDRLRQAGVTDILLDPGFGFGKSLAHNYALLANLHVFSMLDLPILAGVSRKSMIYKLLGKSPEDALAGTCALHMVALQQGASLLRVHDVAEAVDVLRCWREIEVAEKPEFDKWPNYPKTT